MRYFAPTEQASAADRIGIQQVLELERYARDRQQWEQQASCYTEDCVVAAGWFQGTAAQFVARSREQAQKSSRVSGFHHFVPASVRVRSDRALAESACQVLVRCVIDAVELDLLGYTRAFSRLRRVKSNWQIASLHGIYQKDTLTPTLPGAVVPISPKELEGFRPSYRMNSWIMTKLGYTPSQEMLGDDRPDQLEQFYQEAEVWLAGAEL